MYNILKLLKSYPSGLPLINLVKLLNGCKKVYRDPINKVDRGKYTKEFNNLYIKTYRTVRADPFLFGVSKDLGFLWVAPTRGGLDLIKASVKFQLSIKTCKNSPFTWPRRTRPERIEACKIANVINAPPTKKKKTPDELEKLEPIYTQYQKNIRKIESLYTTYLQNIRNRINVLIPIPGLAKPDAELLILPYITRFNDKKKSFELLNKFDAIMQKATNKHEVGVFLTLTTNPKIHKSLWHGNRHFAPAWDKFMSFLTKRLEGKPGFIPIYDEKTDKKKLIRPEYIAAFEYQKESKLIHAHILIFGTKYIVRHEHITAEWERLNQGSINDEFGVKNVNGQWVWIRKKPRKAGDKDAGSYLKKYIKKGVYGDGGHTLYWLFNKRFYTCSRAFMGDPAPVRDHACYTHGGAYNADDMPEWIWSQIHQCDNESLLELYDKHFGR